MLPQLEGGWQNKLLFASKYSGPSFYSYIEGGGCIAVRSWPDAWPADSIWCSLIGSAVGKV